MTPTTANFRQVAADTVSQPDLFAAVCAVQPEQEIVQAARQRRYDGSRVPETRAREIVALRLAGESLRGIQRRTGADPRTVRGVIEVAEAQGIVPALKERLQREMLELAEATVELVRDEMEKGEPDAQIIKAGWVGIGIAADKAAALQVGGDLHLHQHVHVAGPVANDPAEAYAAMLRGPVDVEAEVLTPNSTPIPDVCCPDTASDTNPGAGGQSVGPRAPTSGPADSRAAGGEGGGVVLAPPPPTTHGKP